MPLSLSHLGFGYLMDVVRLDLGCDGESWHRSKPLQRCKLKITGVGSRRSHPSKWHFRSEDGICAL